MKNANYSAGGWIKVPVSMNSEFAVKSTRVILSGTTPPAPSTIVVREGKVAAVEPHHVVISNMTVVDVGHSVVMPGLVDTHAHINEPGRTDWEGFRTATRAAAAGGITTVIDMPLNSIPATTTRAALFQKIESARGQCAINYGYWGGVIPGNVNELQPLIDAGVMGFKAFLCESGVDEFPMSTEADLRASMPILAKAKVPLLVHAELCQPTASLINPEQVRSYRSYLQSRPANWEVDAVRMMVRLTRDTGCRVHIVHLSAADALSDLAAARAEGLPISAETCPHYLSFCSEEIPDGATHFKCAPPIREQQNQDRLWQALIDGTISFVVSDHSPCTPSLKLLESGNFDRAWGGISGLQFSMPVVWTQMRKRNIPIQRLVEWMSSNTSAFIGVQHSKGSLNPGHDADLVVWDPDHSYLLKAEMVQHKHHVTPYEGQTLFGVVQKTFVRGVPVFDEGQFASGLSGVELLRGKESVA